MKNSADQGGLIQDLHDIICSLSYPTKAEFNNCLVHVIIYSKYFQTRRKWTLLNVFLLTKNNTASSLGFLGQRFNNLQQTALLTSFWRHWFNNLQLAAILTSLVQYDRICSKFGQQLQLVMVNYMCGFSQSEMGNNNYFEWMIIAFISDVVSLMQKRSWPKASHLIIVQKKIPQVTRFAQALYPDPCPPQHRSQSDCPVTCWSHCPLCLFQLKHGK